MAAIVTLDHVQLAMPRGREAEARAFYGDLMGMTELTKPPALAVRGGCWFGYGSAILHLGIEEPFAPALKAHPALSVDDLDGWRDRLRAGGAKIIEDDSVPHVRRFFSADPFGNRLEFMQSGDSF